MKHTITSIFAALLIGISIVGCKDGSQRDTSGEQESTQQSDTTYMESQDNNGQPSPDSDGGTVTETEGAPESGYGTANGSDSGTPQESDSDKE